MSVPTSRALERLRAMPEGLLADRFALLAEIGSGGMGTVYRAVDRSSGQTVAVKVILPGSAGDAARFARECEILSALSHPSIVRYVAHGTTSDEEPWLAMEWLEGESMSRRLARGALPWREAVAIGRDVADALAVAHDHDVVHRDLKPGNLFLVAGGGVKVLDFGVARFRAPADGLTKTGQIVGTPGYMAPEQARGEKGITARADLFSLGCVLHHAITGEPPFDGDDVLSVLARLVLEEPPRLARRAPDVPRALDALVHRLLAKAEVDRPASARDVRDALDATLRGEAASTLWEADTLRAAGGAGARESLPTPALRRPVRGPARNVALALATAAIVATIALASRRADPAGAPPSDPATPPSGSASAATCRTWADVLADAQRPDGSFGTEAHREGWGWTTGQELFALGRAHAACGSPSAETLRRGTDALDRLRVEHGWGEGAGSRASTPAVAWAVLALSSVADALGDDAIGARAVESRDLLLAAQRGDGAFSFWMLGEDDSLSPYSTIMALWALAQVADRAESERARDARLRAARWLRGALDGDPAGSEIRDTPGLDEQAAWTLLRASVEEETDAPLLSSIAARVVARCRPDAGACRRPLRENGAAYLDHVEGRGPNLVTLWRPWALLGAARLARTEHLPAAERASMAALAAWGEASMSRDAEAMTVAPSYQLAEYLFALTELVSAQRP